ncbi:Manganese/iron superoxide dismutase [Melampsora americana]|nr:Manganese/iron superoxide dismutase [Melampsora americana]
MNQPTRRFIKALISNQKFNPSRIGIRSLHQLPPTTSLPFNLETGLLPFLSSNTLKTLSIEWQTGLLDRLNQHLQGTGAEHLSLFDSIIHLAKDRTQVQAFNLASEALNNYFFLHGLKKPSADVNQSNRPTEGSLLARAIDDTYGSYTQFVSYFSSAANGMASSGYLWLVCDQDGLLGICPTFASGTILVQNRQQRGDWPLQLGSIQPNDSSAPSSSTTSKTITPTTVPFERAFSTSTQAQEDVPRHPSTSTSSSPSFTNSLFSNPIPLSTPNRSITRKTTEPSERFNQLHPIFTLPITERAYLMDHGVWGKETYLRSFWDVIDWKKCEKAYEARCDIKDNEVKRW